MSHAGPAYSLEVLRACSAVSSQAVRELPFPVKRFALIRLVVEPRDVAGLRINLDAEEFVFQIGPGFRSRPAADDAAAWGLPVSATSR